MRWLALAKLTLLVGVLSAPAAVAQDADPRTLIDKAIQAQGGLDNLSRARAGHHKIKGLFHSDQFSFTGESWSDARRFKVILHADDNTSDRTLVVEETRGWQAYGDAVLEFDAKRVARLRQSSHADKVSGLVALVRDKGYTLTLLGESKVKDAAVLGVKVQYAGMPDMQLYFDKTSGLLVKTAYRLTDLDTDKEYLQEVYYSDFQFADPGAKPLSVLQTAQQDTDDSALFKFLQGRIPDKEDRERIDLLVLELGRSAFSAREKASAALRNFGPQAGGPLRLASRSDDREVARRAEQLLEKLAQSGEPRLATAVVRLLAVRRPAGTAAALMAYLPFACDEAVVKEVQYALVSVIENDAGARQGVESMLKNEDPQRRAAAAAVLGQDGGAFLKQPLRRVVVQGIRSARVVHVFRDGRPHFDMETLEQEFFNQFDDALFARPKSNF